MVMQNTTAAQKAGETRLGSARSDAMSTISRPSKNEFKRFPFLFPSRTMRPPKVLTVSLCSNGVENGVAKEQAETRIFIG
jgi:hypothetical protein